VSSEYALHQMQARQYVIAWVVCGQLTGQFENIFFKILAFFSKCLQFFLKFTFLPVFRKIFHNKFTFSEK